MEQAVSAHTPITYNVAHHRDCILIKGLIPLSALSALSKLAPEGSVMDADAAVVLGVTFAIGPPQQLAALRKKGIPAAILRQQEANPGLFEAAARWLANGERGASSNTIFTHLTGIKATEDHGYDVPHDPSDLRRCRLLLEQVPGLQERFQEMKTLNPAWSKLVDRWDNLCAAMDDEAPEWRTTRGSAPHTLRLIRAAIGR